MRSSSFKKSLAASAVLASSVATVAGFSASAQATQPGASNSPLTVGDGHWAPDGSRYVHADSTGAIYTRNLPGGAEILVDPATPGVVRTNPTFFNNGTAIVFSESVNGGAAKLVAIPTYTPVGTAVPESDPLATPGSKFAEGGDTAPDSNARSLVFQHTNPATHHEDIYVQDDYGRGSAGPILVAEDGSAPTISPDGKTVAFVRNVAGRDQLFTVAWNGQSATPPAGTAHQITTDNRDHEFPAFSADGSRIAFEARTATSGAPDDVESVAADGSGVRVETKTLGGPNYRPLDKNTLTRLEGADRIGTAIAASQAQWPTPPAQATEGRYPADAIVLSRSDDFADALGGSTLATSVGGPLLLTPSAALDTSVKAEIARVLGPASTHKTVYVLGGEKALSPAVYDAVKGMGYTVKRIAGADRYETSVAIAEQITQSTGTATGWNQPSRVLVATGNLFPDALSAGAAAESGPGAGPVSGVVVLTNDKQMPASTAAYLAQVKAHDTANFTTPVYGVGGQADTALTTDGVKHTGLVGTDRYQTSYLVAKTFFGGWEDGTAPSSIGFATGLTWPDALSGGAFMGQKRGPLLLLNPTAGPSNETYEYLFGWAPATNNAYFFGGPAAIDTGVVQSNIGGGISGPAGYDYSVNPKA